MPTYNRQQSHPGLREFVQCGDLSQPGVTFLVTPSVQGGLGHNGKWG